MLMKIPYAEYLFFYIIFLAYNWSHIFFDNTYGYFWICQFKIIATFLFSFLCSWAIQNDSLNFCLLQGLTGTDLAINLIVGQITRHVHVKLVCILIG